MGRSAGRHCSAATSARRSWKGRGRGRADGPRVQPLREGRAPHQLAANQLFACSASNTSVLGLLYEVARGREYRDVIEPKPCGAARRVGEWLSIVFAPM